MMCRQHPGKRESGKRGGFRRAIRVPLLATACVGLGLLVAPTVSSAFSNSFDSSPVSLAARGGIGSFTPASVDPRLAQKIATQIKGHLLGSGRMFRFTPAGMDARPDRSVTVAIRINDASARAISVRNVLADVGTTPGAAPVRIAPTVYNLGMARGYQSFAMAAPGTGTSFAHEVQRIDAPDLRSFGAEAAAGAPSRLAPRFAIDDKERAGRAPRTLEAQGNYQLDLGGSYRLTRNLDVTAGIRYSSDRDRVRPLTDSKQDSQAVYVGTQFRF